MPFVEIFSPAQRPAPQSQQVADAIHRALVATVGIPADDRFQAILPGAPSPLIYDPGYLGVERRSTGSRRSGHMLGTSTVARGRAPNPGV
jgi:hypothetical protein